MSNVEDAKAFLLKHMNERRASQGKGSLSTYPKRGCGSCGDMCSENKRLLKDGTEDLLTCDRCLLGSHPFSLLPLPEAETIEWYLDGTDYDSPLDYGVVLTNRALYGFFSFWLIFSRWRRFPLRQICDASFHDSRRFPALHLTLVNRTVVLRTPPRAHIEMEFDRRVLMEVAGRIRSLTKRRVA